MPSGPESMVGQAGMREELASCTLGASWWKPWRSTAGSGGRAARARWSTRATKGRCTPSSWEPGITRSPTSGQLHALPAVLAGQAGRPRGRAGRRGDGVGHGGGDDHALSVPAERGLPAGQRLPVRRDNSWRDPEPQVYGGRDLRPTRLFTCGQVGERPGKREDSVGAAIADLADVDSPLQRGERSGSTGNKRRRSRRGTSALTRHGVSRSRRAARSRATATRPATSHAGLGRVRICQHGVGGDRQQADHKVDAVQQRTG